MRLDIFQRNHERSVPRRASGGAVASASPGGRGLLWPGLLMGLVGLLVLAALAFGGLAFLWSRPAVVADAVALAHVDLPLTGGTIESVRAFGPSGRPIPIEVRDGRLWPRVVLAPGEPISIEVVLRRAGWIAWLAGRRDSERSAPAHPERGAARPLRDARSPLAAAAGIRRTRARGRVRAAGTPSAPRARERRVARSRFRAPAKPARSRWRPSRGAGRACRHRHS